MSPKAIKGKQRRRKTTVKTTVRRKTGELIPQPHGGAIRNGGSNAGGPGRPPSAIRDRFREALDRRLPVLEEIADGHPVEKIRITLASILPHVVCPNCNDPLEYNGDVPPSLVTIEAVVSAKARDRVLAIKGMADVGMTSSRLDVEEVRLRLRDTLAIIRAELTGKDAERLIGRLKPVWAAA